MAAALVPTAESFNPSWFSDWSPKDLVSLVGEQMTKIGELRADYGREASSFTRMSDAVADSVLAVTAAAAVPLLLEAFPRLKRIGRGAIYVDGHAIAALLVLIAGGVMVTLGRTGGRTVLAAGQGIAAGYAAMKARDMGREWFPSGALPAAA